jgi:type IV pilus assembly protein PilN
MFKNLFKKKTDATPAPTDATKVSESNQESKNVDKNPKGFFAKIKSKLAPVLKNKLGKSAIQGEEILGIEITATEIRLAQVTSNKSNQWILEKFYIHPTKLPEDALVLDNLDTLGSELQLAIQRSKITTTNAAIAIPVTSAIIRVVTSPLMTDEELKKAVETDSLWENLVQLTDNLADYSIFHQVINRNEKDNTMDILFVASKLSDINNYTKIIKKGGLNPVIIDVKCFALKSAVDQINQLSGSIENSNLTALLEFGMDENYVMILYENNPIITDIFIRGQDRNTIKDISNQEETEAFTRRYITQVKQAISDFEVKYEKRIRNIKVVSSEKNIDTFLEGFRKTLANTGFNLLDPLDQIKIPAQLEESTNIIANKSYLSTVMGLAFRKLDVFGYYKFVTAVKNINLLPNRDNMIKQKKMKVFSNFAFKGVIGVVALIYIALFGLSFWNIQKYNKQLVDYENIITTHELKTVEKDALAKKVSIMSKTLKLSKSIKSNKKFSYRILAQVASSVPNRVRFQSLEYNGSDLLIVSGDAFSDQDILKLIANLNTKSLISQASLASMNLPSSGEGKSQVMKGFKIAVVLKGDI